MKTKRIHYITNAVGTQDKTFDTYADAKIMLQANALY